MSAKLALKFFNKILGSIDNVQPEIVGGGKLAEILWPLNDIFRSRMDRILSIRYDPKFEDEADKAIERFASNPIPSSWEDISPGAWRVLFERHRQLIIVAMINEKTGNAFTTIPSGLPESAILPGIMLLLLHEMKLPFSVGDQKDLGVWQGLPPESMKRH